jgi:hypothetical protein
VHDPHDADLPVDLLGTLLPERHIGCATVRAEPFPLGHVVDLLDRLQARVVPPAVPTATRLLPTAPPLGMLATVGVIRLGFARLPLFR